MPKENKARSSLKHDPLATQMHQSQLEGQGNLSLPGKRQKRAKDIKPDETVLDSKVSRKVLAMAREQQDEMDIEEKSGENWQTELDRRLEAAGEEFSDEDDSVNGDEDEYEYEELEYDENDQAILDKYMGSNQLQGGKTLADLIMEKINEAESTQKPSLTFGGDESNKKEPPVEFNIKVVEVYTRVGSLLSRYKSGPLPKAFKILPTLPMWLHLVMLTNPEKWTPHATYAATKIFTSNLDPKQSQKFNKLILLEKIREEISETGKLNVYSYSALKKAIYKPAAFFKGIIFPLCESGTCTLREAAIIGSVLTKVSVPILHSGAALLKLADMEYTGPNSLFIRVLLDKKYALPYKVVDSLVFHFLRFKKEAQVMPVLWHQAFLVFVQRYKQDLTPEQKDALLELLRFQVHPQITLEIRREIVNSVARGEIITEMEGDTGMEVEIL